MQDRQRQIMQALVEAYIAYHEPISSGFLSRHFQDAWSSATMRNDLADLLRQGYVKKMYCSSGNVPTAKAYQFFVDAVLDLDHAQKPESRDGGFQTLDDAARFVADRTGNMNVLIDESMNMVLDGIEELFAQPDFSTREEYRALARMIDEIQDRRLELFRAFLEREPSVFVGAASPMASGNVETAMFSAGVRTADGTRVVSILVGPARMPYRRNWDAFWSARNRLARSKPRSV